MLALIVALSIVTLAYASRWLQLPAHPRTADAIIVLAGSFERSLYAADLYNQDYAAKVYVSVPAPDPGSRKVEALGIALPRDFEIHRQILIKKGVPPRDVLGFGQDSLSTADEADALRRAFTKPGQSLLVVTSPYHSRRAKLILERVFEGGGIDVTVVATPYEEFRDDWWRSQDNARNTLLELAKIAYFYLGGRFRSTTASDNTKDSADHVRAQPARH